MRATPNSPGPHVNADAEPATPSGRLVKVPSLVFHATSARSPFHDQAPKSFPAVDGATWHRPASGNAPASPKTPPSMSGAASRDVPGGGFGRGGGFRGL